jgi:Ca-activated chloride channel family protein
VKLEPTACDSDGKEKIFKVLESLSASGSTRGFNALEKAYDLAQEHFISGGNNRILLATDGDFNVGPSSDAALVELVEEKAKSGIFITVLGYGMYNLNDSMMEKISNAGNGNYFYIDNMSEAKKALGTGLWGNLFVVAKDVKVLVDFNPNIVKSYRLIGYENRMLANEDFDNDKKDAGDMGSGHTVTAIYELVTASSKKQIQNTSTKSEYTKSTSTGDTENYLTVKFRYKNPQDTVSQLVEKKVNKSTFTEKPSSDFILASSVASFGMLLRGAKYAGDATYDSVLEHLKDIPSDPNGYVNELRTLVRKANDLDKKNGANKADDLNKEEEASAPQAVY